ncbi:hypothetical protein [Nostoc sp.]|uniref:hypothetical protein n=1 Tax=Nostoc sp. TaxID=1180 RepID=UPI002FF75027
MESTLFIPLSTNEEANLSGGINRSFNNDKVSIGNTAIAIPVNIAVGGGNGGGNRNGNLFNGQVAVANAGNIK